MSDQAQYTDTLGRHVWIGLEATQVERSVVLPSTLDDLEGGVLDAQVQWIYGNSSRVSVVRNGVPLFAVSNRGANKARAVGEFTTYSRDVTSLPLRDSCYTTVERSLSVGWRGETVNILNGHSVVLDLDGVEAVVSNIFTEERSDVACLHTAGGVLSTWFVTTVGSR